MRYLLILTIVLCSCKTCIKSHKEICHRKAYTSMTMAGKVPIVQYHRAYDYECDICDKYED